MTSPYWAKLWIEILDDPKVANMPDWLFRKFIIFVLAAKEYDHAGLLQPVDDLAWRIRSNVKETADALSALEQIGVTRATADGWELINFVKRQEREYSDTPEAIRQRRYREKHNNKENNNNNNIQTYNNNKHNKKALHDNSDTSISISSSVSVSDSFSDSDSLTQSNIFSLYQKEIGLITPMIAEDLKDAEKEYPEDYVTDAIHEAVRRNKRSWGYIASILKSWKAQGHKSIGGRAANKLGVVDIHATEDGRNKYGEWETR